MGPEKHRFDPWASFATMVFKRNYFPSLDLNLTLNRFFILHRFGIKIKNTTTPDHGKKNGGGGSYPPPPRFDYL